MKGNANSEDVNFTSYILWIISFIETDYIEVNASFMPPNLWVKLSWKACDHYTLAYIIYRAPILHGLSLGLKLETNVYEYGNCFYE